jgi:ubiquinone/menaquinone biosynthesis C-methylase UbiE
MANYDIKKWIAEHPEEEQYKHLFLDKNQLKVLYDLGVKSGQVVLDFGCGSGTYTIPAAKMIGASGKVYALDINNAALDKVEAMARQEGLTNIIRIDSSAEAKIPLKNETIDVMLVIDVLHLIKDKESLFGEAFRILRMNGLLIVFLMHVSEKEVMDLATNRMLHLEGKKFQDRFLIFKKKV